MPSTKIPIKAVIAAPERETRMIYDTTIVYYWPPDEPDGSKGIGHWEHEIESSGAQIGDSFGIKMPTGPGMWIYEAYAHYFSYGGFSEPEEHDMEYLDEVYRRPTEDEMARMCRGENPFQDTV